MKKMKPKMMALFKYIMFLKLSEQALKVVELFVLKCEK